MLHSNTGFLNGLKRFIIYLLTASFCGFVAIAIIWLSGGESYGKSSYYIFFFSVFGFVFALLLLFLTVKNAIANGKLKSANDLRSSEGYSDNYFHFIEEMAKNAKKPQEKIDRWLYVVGEYIDAGQYKKAQECLLAISEMVVLREQIAQFNALFSYCLIMNGDLDTAGAFIERSKPLHNSLSMPKSIIAFDSFVKGCYNYAKGDYNNAVKLFETARVASKDGAKTDITAGLHMALAYLKLNQWELARQIAKELISFEKLGLTTPRQSADLAKLKEIIEKTKPTVEIPQADEVGNGTVN